MSLKDEAPDSQGLTNVRRGSIVRISRKGENRFGNFIISDIIGLKVKHDSSSISVRRVPHQSRYVSEKWMAEHDPGLIVGWADLERETIPINRHCCFIECITGVKLCSDETGEKVELSLEDGGWTKKDTSTIYEFEETPDTSKPESSAYLVLCDGLNPKLNEKFTGDDVRIFTSFNMAVEYAMSGSTDPRIFPEFWNRERIRKLEDDEENERNWSFENRFEPTIDFWPLRKEEIYVDLVEDGQASSSGVILRIFKIPIDQFILTKASRG